MNVPIYSNYRVEYEHYAIKIPEQMKKIKFGIFLGDELWSWIDARASMKSSNKIRDDILLASRKKGYHIFYTAQQKGLTDKRLRELSDFLGFPEYDRNSMTCKLSFYEYYGNNMLSEKPTRKFVINAKPVFELYDSYKGIYEKEHEY